MKKMLDKLDGLIGVHACWKAKILDAIKHKYPLDAEMISKSDCCDFGIFINDETTVKRLRRFPHYQDVIDLHSKFHLEMAEVAKISNTGESEKAIQMLNNSSYFYETSSLLVRSIMELKKEAKEKFSDIS